MERPIQFEFIINEGQLRRLAGDRWIEPAGPLDLAKDYVAGFYSGGYDYAVVPAWALGFLSFPSGERARGESIGMAHGGVIIDRKSFEAYPWQDPEADRWEILAKLKPDMPDGMKCIISSNGGVLENLMSLVGYEELCLLTEDDPALVKEIADAIGSRLLRFYQRGLEQEIVGAAIVNDDWGFKTGLFFSPQQMREFIMPWHRRIVQAIHSAGRPAIMHCCGDLRLVWDDIIDDLQFDGKHSYEDNILPVEDAYERYGSRIAILGGLDLDYLCRSTPEQVYARTRAMIDRTQARGGYGVGSGNSIAEYVPAANYDAMRRAALEWS